MRRARRQAMRRTRRRADKRAIQMGYAVKTTRTLLRGLLMARNKYESNKGLALAMERIWRLRSQIGHWTVRMSHQSGRQRHHSDGINLLSTDGVRHQISGDGGGGVASVMPWRRAQQNGQAEQSMIVCCSALDRLQHQINITHLHQV